MYVNPLSSVAPQSLREKILGMSGAEHSVGGDPASPGTAWKNVTTPKQSPLSNGRGP